MNEAARDGRRRRERARTAGMTDETVLTLGPTPESDRYLTLGRAIARQCPPGFREARLEAELDPGSSTMRLACTAQDGSETGVNIDPTARTDIHQLLEDIRGRMAEESGGQGWRRCVVTLREGGRFRMDVE